MAIQAPPGPGGGVGARILLRRGDALATVQSNISAHVARLEKELGTPLATARPAGSRPKASRRRPRYRILGEIDAVTARPGALRQDVGGTVRIGMIGTMARWITPVLLADLS